MKVPENELPAFSHNPDKPAYPLAAKTYYKAWCHTHLPEEKQKTPHHAMHVRSK